MEDVLSADGTVVSIDAAQARLVGILPQEAAGLPWSRIYTLDARERIAAQFATPSPLPRVVPLTLRKAGGDLVQAVAVADLFHDADRGPCLRLSKWPAGGELDDVAALAEANEVLAGIVAASSDAGWCMEWADPVDLSAPEHEIVRQVFENGPRWRFCNDAMARLYRAPPGQDFNARPVSETFPRTPENEDFIRRLIRADFDMNGSPSRDLRYDGVFIDVENDVRGQIRGNRLFRMWGTVRDVSKHVHREAVLRDEIAFLQAVLAGLPDPVLVADPSGRILYMNMAAEALLEIPADQQPEARLEDLLEGMLPMERLIADARSSRVTTAREPFIAFAPLPGGKVMVEGTAQTFEVRGETLISVCLRHVPRAVERDSLLSAGGLAR
jgi:PAS domain-containing protein